MNREVFFVHINKCAGSSIERALGLPFQHKTAAEFKQEVGVERWQNGFSFTFVRNPWDRVVSHYHWRMYTNQTNLSSNPIPFPEWVERAYGKKDVAYYDKPKMFMPQSKWLREYHEQGSKELMVEFVGRFESLGRDFERLLAMIAPHAKPNLPHIKKTQRGPYQSYYTLSTKKIVSEWFSEDIERFGYAF